jgi:hypothetical protein
MTSLPRKLARLLQGHAPRTAAGDPGSLRPARAAA